MKFLKVTKFIMNTKKDFEIVDMTISQVRKELVDNKGINKEYPKLRTDLSYFKLEEVKASNKKNTKRGNEE